jgi:nitrogen fixation protein FixH
MRRILSIFRLHDDNPLTGWHALGIVCLFFGVIIAVNVAMALAATGTFPGLVVKNSYVASQHYNALLAESRAQKERGWSVDLQAENGLLHVRLADPSDAPISGLDVMARVGRPASASQDRVVDFEIGSDGYVATAPLPPGRWMVELEAWSSGRLVYRATHPLLVGGGGS